MKPNSEYRESVIKAIGMPPSAVIFPRLRAEVGGTVEELEAVLDDLYAEGKIDLTNGWIHGVKRIDTSNWTKDDWDYIRGTGRFAQ